ncbi:MAG: M1 family metallopeptidase [Cyclobacteriaceae bacterium]|nr:M1 family metallopeptidase [Cytophagales bacterium]MBX2898962.1 M1 family metallopeptidase [Cyclobacteriaceae bacterium]
MKKVLFTLLLLATLPAFAQQKWQGKFEQLDQTLPTPNSYRSASGAPGANYWQQRADYDIDVDLNEDTQVITGKETITYYNNSPETLRYLWLQLDQNNLASGSLTAKTETNRVRDSIPVKFFPLAGDALNYTGGFKIKSVKDASGKDLPFTINFTMMRVDLPTPMKPGDKYAFSVEWSYVEKDRMKFGQRGGYEIFPEDGNALYTIAQWFPRMCVFDDYEGWQNKQFIGQGEYALVFGNYRVRITVPADHIVGATGMLQNPKDVLTKEQIERFERAKKTFDAPVFIVTEAEARKKEKERAKKKSTWDFYAENVRDFAFATSRKFIWDAQAVKVGDKTPLAQSLYPKEGNPLWAKESTKAIKNTLEVYSARTFDYPYPTAYSVHTANQGMEYPMICFNGGRPKPDGTWSHRTYEGMVGVIVHEVGHNFFPMIVNSDERQWSWMDEGLNSFLEREVKRERYPDIGISWGSPKGMAGYMRGDKNMMRPIMWHSDNIPQGDFGPNAYGKPAAALTLLRETIMGPELFDKAFKEYSLRWMFKHPKPADFFRTMEDASAVDLDWFWRGWFYTVDNVDVELDEVKWFKVKTETKSVENKSLKVQKGDLATGNAKGKATDFSNGPQEFTLLNTPDTYYGDFRNRLADADVKQQLAEKNIYEITLKNKGGLVTPVIVEWTFKDGTKEIENLPAEIWRLNETEVKKVFVKEKEVTHVVIDPTGETGEVNPADNIFPKKPTESKFDQLKKN